MANKITLAVLLSLFWLALSGYFKTLLLSLGVVSVIIVMIMVIRMEAAEKGDYALPNIIKVLGFLPWLIVEVIKSNLEVARIIIDPKMPISPTMVTLTGTQKTDFGRMIYANAITLTPGTLTVDLGDNRFRVHALTRGTAEFLLAGEMDRRVTALELEGSR